MAVGLVGAATASEVRYVDAFDLSGSTCGLGLRTLPRQSVGGHPLTVGGKVYERGFGTHSEGAVGFRTDGMVESFDARVAIDDAGAETTQAVRLGGSGRPFRNSYSKWFLYAPTFDFKPLDGASGCRFDIKGANCDGVPMNGKCWQVKR